MASSSYFQIEDSGRLSELRIVLLGLNQEDRRSAGNTILGREEFDNEKLTTQCVRKQSAVAGREVTVINTPDKQIWHCMEDPPVKQWIEDSVSQCPPGPHAFLIVIPVETLIGREWNVEAPLDILPERVWRHTVVLFTSEEKLSEKAIEQHIEREKCLQQIVKKCGNRYHVLNTTDRADGTQITELLQKIEGMVAGNSGAHFLLDEALQELEEKRRAVEERGKQRLMKVQKQRKTLRALIMGESHRLSELRIILLGKQGWGRSSVGNTILGREEFHTSTLTTECVKAQGSVAERQVTVYDTPGWYGRSSPEEIAEKVKQEIMHSVSQFPAESHALLLVINVRYSFTETERREVEEYLDFLIDGVWRHTIVLLTMGDSLKDRSIEQHIESWTALQWLIDKCGNRYHVLDDYSKANGTQVTELLEKIEEMVAGNDLLNSSIKMSLETEKRIRELKHRCEEKERENEELKSKGLELEKEMKRKMEEMSQMCEEEQQRHKRDVKQLREEQQRELEELKGENEELRKRERTGKKVEMSQLKEELSKLQREKEESMAPVWNIMEMDVHMSGEKGPGSTELLSQEEENRQKDRDRQMQRQEEELRAQHQAEQEERERRMRKEMRRLIKPLEEKIQDLEGELRRDREQREKFERVEKKSREEEQRERKDREERQRGEMQALRQRYRSYLNVGAGVLGAVIGAIAGALIEPLGAAAGTAIGAVAGAQLGALIRGGERDGGMRREERRRSTKQSTPPVRRRNSLPVQPANM